MIHIVMFQVKPDAAEADVTRLVTGAHEKLAQIPGVSNLRAGWVMQSDCPYRVVLSMELPDEAALEAYRSHPLHGEYIEEAVRPVEERRLVVDMADTPR